MNPDVWSPDAGDLIWTDFNTTNGREQAGRRPVLVASSKVFAASTGLSVVYPITSRMRPFPASVVLPAGLPVESEILTSHIRSIDTQARPILYAGATVPDSVAEEVRARLAMSLRFSA